VDPCANEIATVLIIIPARGGSKGIPRKNLRALNGRPLLAYSAGTARESRYKADIYVSSEDQEILTLARKLGVKAHQRDPDKARDDTTLDPVIFDVYQFAQIQENKRYDIVVTFQPTSPLIRPSTLDSAIERLVQHPEIDTLITATNDTHLTWKMEEGKYLPNYAQRVNRQFLPQTFKETGGLMLTRSRCISATGRIGSRVDLFLLAGSESIDIDSYEDWSLCEYYLRRKKILFVVSGFKEIGLGHVYNTLLLANDILNHEVVFLVDDRSEMAYRKIAERNYPVQMQRSADIVDDIRCLSPDMVVNDVLDTTNEYMLALKNFGSKILNFEDLGSGASHADLVVNAMYPEQDILPRHYFGHKYFCLRDEFLFTSRMEVQKNVENVLLTFGGVDPCNFTLKVLDAIYEYCRAQNISITVVAGFGYDKYDTIQGFENITIASNASNMSDHMHMADIVFTSAGRTTFEVAAIGTPAIVLCQNQREATHFFATKEHGFLNLGLGSLLPRDDILQVFSSLCESFDRRAHMASLMRQIDLTQGRANVLKLLIQTLEQ
jgi:CMP-N-acetylneuraminic acid synthetase/spore coat polysaccharide biosynthesis predicted glycosyltransferase SpsG